MQVPMLRVLHFAICDKKKINHYKCTRILCVSKCNGKFGDCLLVNSIASALNKRFFFFFVMSMMNAHLSLNLKINKYILLF